MSAISSVAASLDYASQYLDYTNRVLASGNISAESVTAQLASETLVEVESALLQKTLAIDAAQSQQLIDLIA